MTLHPETIARVRGHIARNLRLGQSWDDMRRNANASAARLGAEIAATITSPSEANDKRLAELFERAADMRAQYAAFDIAWIGATQPERLPPLAATGGGRGGCQQPRRGTFLRASLTAYNPKGDLEDGAFHAAVWTRDFDYSANGSRNGDHRSLRRTLLNPGNAIALARRSARLNIRASEALRAKIASHITISAKLLVGVAVLSRPTPPTTAKFQENAAQPKPLTMAA